ncbi:MAG TPA: TrpR-like protein, YerC/YecD [Clostridiales bacterium]|nr:TrpR-like protein, YerC/YecD [Clostridiales bacterium]
MSKIRDKNTDLLFKAVLTLKTLDECYDFFEDICTIKEIKSIAQRVVVAKMLMENKVYSEIVAATGASTATISRVNRSLQYGNGGYKLAFERIEKNEQL